MFEIKATRSGVSLIRDPLSSNYFRTLKAVTYAAPVKPKGYEESKVKPFPINACFAMYMVLHKRIPTADELVVFYNLMYKQDRFDTKYSGGGNQEFEEYRVRRSYPSLVRDFHLLYLLQQSDAFDAADYSLHRDLNDGIDIEVEYEGHRFGVCLFIDTYNAQKFNRQQSNYRTKDIPQITVALDEAQKSLNVQGGIWLYSDYAVSLIKTHCNQQIAYKNK